MGREMGETTGGVLRRGSDRILGGVCSGLATYFGLDPLLVRVAFLLIAFIPPGIGIILYLLLWFLMEPPSGSSAATSYNLGDRIRAIGDDIRDDFRSGFSRPTPTASIQSAPPRQGWQSQIAGRSRGFWAGVLLVVLGGYLLIDNLGLLRGFRWELVGPVILIAIGVLLLARRR